MFLQEKTHDINERLKVLANISDIVIWGAGVHTCKMFEKTDLLSYNINSIVDMDKRKCGDNYFGFAIKNPEEICWSNINAVVISVFNKDKQIIELLRNTLGYTGSIVTLYDDHESTPFYCLYDKKIESIWYLGDYNNWNDAYNESEGYEDDTIIDTASSAIQKVLNGEAVWERDGFLFYEQKYVYQICAAILKCALQNGNQGVRILDIGGGHGEYIFSK